MDRNILTHISQTPQGSLSSAGVKRQEQRCEPESTISWSCSGQTTEKPVNDCFKSGEQVIWRKSEDRFRLVEATTSIIAAIADGAGSSGMYCGPWAETLVERLPESPVANIDQLNKWIDSFWKDFSDTHKKQAIPEPTKLNKFVREGSCSTLVACWLSKGDDADGETSVTMHWIGYGDSPLFVFQRNDKALSLTQFFPDSLTEMDRDPHLLNWKDLPKETPLRTGKINLSGPATVVLASDGIGQFVLMQYLAGVYVRHATSEDNIILDDLHKSLLDEFRLLYRNGSGKLSDMARQHVDNFDNNFIGELSNLREALKTQSAFAEAIKQYHVDGMVPNDDSTLIMIDIEFYDGQLSMTTDITVNNDVSHDLRNAVNEP